MSMSIDIGEDADELNDDDLDRDDDRDDEDDDDDEDGGRSTRGNGRRRQKDTSDDEEDDDDDDEDLSPEELRAELKKARAALGRMGKQTVRQRNARKALAKRVRDLEGQSDDEGDDDEADGEDDKPTAKSIQKTVSRAVRERERQLQDEHRRDLVSTRAETKLTRAGVNEKNLRLLIRELDFDEIDFDPKTRAIDGLDDEIDRLKDEFPDLFRRPRGSRRRVNGGDDREDRSTKRKRPMTTTEIQAAQLRGH
jgi:hypothetical protein